MKTLLAILLAIFCAASAYGQTIRSLGYNSTNGNIVAATNVVWTNAFSFSANTAAAQVRTNLALGANWLTNSSAANFRTAIGLGDTNQPTFKGFFFTNVNSASAEILAYMEDSTVLELATEGSQKIAINDAEIQMWRAISFQNDTAGATRANLGIPWIGLTETNAANFQGALFAATNAAPTNTNAPTPNAWLDVRVGTNTYKLPLWQ